jgi:hypothetical protein
VHAYLSVCVYVCMYGCVYIHMRSPDSVLGISTGYGLDDLGVGVRVQVGTRILYSPRLPDQIRGPPSLLCNGLKLQGREAGHSPISAEVRKI